MKFSYSILTLSYLLSAGSASVTVYVLPLPLIYLTLFSGNLNFKYPFSSPVVRIEVLGFLALHRFIFETLLPFKFSLLKSIIKPYLFMPFKSFTNVIFFVGFGTGLVSTESPIFPSTIVDVKTFCVDGPNLS